MANETSSSPTFTLSQSLSLADSQPVRSMCILESNVDSESMVELIAGSQNGVLSIFNLESTTNECLSMIPKDGSQPHTTTALLSIPGKNSGYAAGSRDANIRIYSNDHTLLQTLTGHEKPVTSLSWLSINEDHQYLLSGSWDGSAKIWDLTKGACVATLPDHENTVAVLGLNFAGKLGETGKVVTASAGIAEGGKIVDHKIRVWSVRAQQNTLCCTLLHKPSDNHFGPIRGLSCSESSPGLFCSCSNDGSAKFRDAENGECTSTISLDEGAGQPPILLDIQTSSSGFVAAAVEDGTLAIWSQETNKIQRIPHPGCVWKVMFLRNGDICTACQDGYVRIFTCESSRFAKPDDIEKFEDSAMETRRKASTGPSAEEIEKLPKWEMRSIHSGRSDGQVQVFSREGKAIAAQWNNASRTWIEVGEVMGSNKNAGSIDGVKYDHVLPIEVDVPGGGVQKLELGYNNGENPFVTAQNFIDTYMLDQNYLSQIADYIRQRVGDSAVTIGGGTSSSSSSLTQSALTMSPPSKQQRIYQHIPMKGYLVFDITDMSKSLPKIINKITVFNQENGEVIEMNALNRLQNTLLATSRYHSSKIGMDELHVLKACLQNWDIHTIFPILDLIRICALHPDASSREKGSFWSELIDIILAKCALVTLENASNNKLIAAVPMLCLRIFTNSFRGGQGSLDAVSTNLLLVLSTAKKFSKFALSNKNLRLTIATLLLNASSFLNSSSSSSTSSEHIEYRKEILHIALNIFKSKEYESDAMNRTLLAVGTTLLSKDAKIIGVEMKALEETLQLNNLKGKGPEIVDEITSLMQ